MKTGRIYHRDLLASHMLKAEFWLNLPALVLLAHTWNVDVRIACNNTIHSTHLEGLFQGFNLSSVRRLFQQEIHSSTHLWYVLFRWHFLKSQMITAFTLGKLGHLDYTIVRRCSYCVIQVVICGGSLCLCYWWCLCRLWAANMEIKLYILVISKQKAYIW